MATSEILQYQQGTDVALPPEGFEQVTNPLGPPKRTSSRLAHFPDDIYDTSAETHIARFMKVLLGDSGVAQLHKRNLLARLQQTMGGINFFDLDAFYGAVLGVRRREAELLIKDPLNETLTPEEWDQARIRDGSYRSRIEQFAKALNMGATIRGIEATAEALLGCQCDVYESWRQDDRITQTWSGLQSTYASWTSMEGRSWSDLENGGTRPFAQRHIIWVFPHRTLTIEEQYSVQFSLERLKPAGTLVIVERAVSDSYSKIPIAGVYADSTHWEIRSAVRNTLILGTELLFPGAEDAIVPVSPPAWGAYQGEAWTLLANNPVVVAYTTPGDVSVADQIDPLSLDVVPQRVRIDDQEISFGPSNAVRPIQATMAGRSVSDGVLACNPHTGWGSKKPTDDTRGSRIRMIDFGSFDPSVPADVYVDGIELGALSKVITRDRAGRSAPLFWTSAVRPVDAPDNEIIEIRLSAEEEFNHVSYEIASFPQVVDVQAWVAELGQWISVHTQNYHSSNPAGITGAIPRGYLHPYHHGNDHWTKIRASVSPTKASRIRFVMKRLTNGSPPVGFDGKPVAYPLGLRHVDIGYRVSSRSAIPNTDFASPISTTANVLGQPIQNSVTVFKAAYAADDSETFWKCEAQPISQAVVNMYLDVSDTQGNPQVFDRLFLDPYTTGPTMNLYWSNLSPDSTDLASAESKESPLMPTAVNGSLTVVGSGDRGIIWPTGVPAWFDFDNNEINFDPTKSWWWACEFYPNFPTNLVPDRACLFSSGTAQDATDYGDVSLVFNSAGSFTFRFCGLSITTAVWDWTPGQKIKLAGKWDADAQTIQLVVTNPTGPQVVVGSPAGIYTPLTENPDSIRLGRSLGSSVSNDVSLDITMLQFVMGYGDHDLEVVCQGTTLETYTTKPRYSDAGIDRTMGTFLRYHPSYVEWASEQGYSYGFMGGHVDLWSNVEWSPIAQDFVLAKGHVRFPLVRARYLKLEFTNLAPEPFETFLSHSKMVKLFSSSSTTLPPQTGRAIGSEPQPVYSTDQAVSDRFSANGPIPPPQFERTVGSTTADDPYRLRPAPTTGLVVSDPVAAARLSSFAGYGFDMLKWQPARLPRQFTQKGKHVYDSAVLEHSNKIAFFAGVREVQVSRSDMKTPLDTPVYVDPFYDMENIDSYTTNYDPGLFYTNPTAAPAPLASPQTVTSKTFMTFTPVTELQFATQQTPPQQIMPDDQFRDTALASSTFEDDASWHSYGDGRVLWDSTRQGVLVTRNPASVVTYIELDTPIIHPPITPVFTSTPTVTSVISASASGGIESPEVVPSKGGLLNVAIRLTPLSTLQGSLYIQLIGSDGTTVLMEKEVTSQPGVQVEAVMPYVLNSQPLLEGTVRVRLVQKGPFRDEWIMNTFSLFDDGMLWEFSNDSGVEWMPAIRVRNNFAGIVNFPKDSNSIKWRCTMYRQSVGIDMIDIRPWHKGKVG